MSTAAPANPAASPACNLCGCSRASVWHDQGWRRVLRCTGCGLTFVDPMPTPAQKAEIERQAYAGEVLAETADFFRNCNRDFHDDPVIEAFREGLRGVGRLRRPGRMLDVGPGTGIFLHLARTEFGWNPNGVDICEESATKAREEFGLELVVGDFATWPWEPASFDAVTMLDVLEHTIDPAAALGRAFDLLKPGGVLYVVVPNQHCLMTQVLDRWIRAGGPMRSFFLERLYVSPHVYYFGPRTLRRYLQQAGFDVASVRTGNVYLGRYRLPLWMRLPMEAMLLLGQMMGMGAKLEALAVKP